MTKDPSDRTTGWRVLHLGLGRFHRAHQAVYFQRYNELKNTSHVARDSSKIEVTSFSMRSNEARDEMRNVGLKYLVVETSRDQSAVRFIDCIGEVGSLLSDFDLFLHRMSDPQTQIVTLTITEKGYCLDLNGDLDMAQAVGPSSRHGARSDQRSASHSAISALAAGLHARAVRATSMGTKAPLTIVSCDNMHANGQRLERAVRQFLEIKNETATIEFLKTHVRFPSTMVDRIVPALTKADHQRFERENNVQSPALVATEEFSQWVIEDQFAGQRPELEIVGVEFTKDITAFEKRKLRLLNATHSLLAYSGMLAGHQFVHEAIQDPAIRTLAHQLITNDAGPLLDFEGVSEGLKNYETQIIRRFENNRLPHQLKQIAADGSLKIPLRLLPTIEEQIKKGFEPTAAGAAVVNWMLFIHRELSKSMSGESNILSDPKTEIFKGVWTRDRMNFVSQMAVRPEFFGSLASNPHWPNLVTKILTRSI